MKAQSSSLFNLYFLSAGLINIGRHSGIIRQDAAKEGRKAEELLAGPRRHQGQPGQVRQEGDAGAGGGEEEQGARAAGHPHPRHGLRRGR